MAVSRLAVCPGSFDPLTFGHLDMIQRGAAIFDRLVVAVLANPQKEPWFSIDDRVAMAREAIATLPSVDNVEVDTFDGLISEYVRRRQAVALVRGLRSASELADEGPMAMMNRHLNPGCETVFLIPTPSVSYISSRLVKDVARLGGRLDGLVPDPVAIRLKTLRSASGAVHV
jgi:pantetheine-phosphate adenylyltransferase